MNYRPDIDGLRAVAVLAVVLYHLGLCGFGGGFVGVDVFFVISGYLITRIISADLDQGRFTVAGFYERRVRRLLPAFLAVMVFSTVAALVVLLPSDLERFSAGAASASLLVSNIWFWRNTGYFDSAAEYSPMLHMWSLSVEEQFYIVFPVFLILIRRWFPAHVRGILLGAAVLSLLLCEVVLSSRPSAAFFLPFFRAWELLLGCLLALWPERPRSGATLRLLNESAASAGLLLILTSVILFTEGTRFPGISALLPCLGAGLVVRYGAGTRIGAMLSWRPMVLIGLASYSLYLWHWPLIVLARHLLLRPFTAGEIAALFGVSLAMAFLSWRFVERPFRSGSVRIPRYRLLAGTLVALLAVTGVFVGLRAAEGLPRRFPPQTVLLDGERSPHIPFRECFESTPERRDGNFCAVGDLSKVVPEMLIWGDSHSLALLPALDSVLRLQGIRALYAGTSACPPLFGVSNRSSRQNWGCPEFSSGVQHALDRNPSVQRVMMAAAWSAYTDEGGYRLMDHVGNAGNEKVFAAAFEETLRTLASAGKDVIVIGEVPYPGKDVPLLMARASIRMESVPQSEFATALERTKAFRGLMEDLRGNIPFKVVDIAAAYCRGESCLVHVGGLPLYRDAGHLNVRGALRAIPLLGAALD